ncbi:MAG: hypothetical protein AAGJ93_08930, partial [Bacteroidota bacterium]
MRAISTLLFFLLVSSVVWAQPLNDECVDAENIDLGAILACDDPNTSVSLQGDNIDATAFTPFPTFVDCEGGGSTDAPGAEVWYSFEAVGLLTTITIDGLTRPNIVAYIEGDDGCGSFNAIECGAANGSIEINFLTIAGDTYYFMVSGGDIDDQGTFDIEIESSNDCGVCLEPDFATLNISPDPDNGTFS